MTALESVDEELKSAANASGMSIQLYRWRIDLNFVAAYWITTLSIS